MKPTQLAYRDIMNHLDNYENELNKMSQTIRAMQLEIIRLSVLMEEGL